jgi:hypothetical protein
LRPSACSVIAGDHLARGTHENFEHAKLGAGERHRLAGDVNQVRPGVQRDRTDGEFVRHGRFSGAIAGAAQNRADARHQLARIEGFAQVIVGPELQAHDPVDVVPARREHQDRGFVGRSQFAQHVEAADARQHHVENQDLEIVRLQLFQRLASVVHALHVEVLGVQILGEHLTEFAVIVDQQDSRFGI